VSGYGWLAFGWLAKPKWNRKPNYTAIRTILIDGNQLLSDFWGHSEDKAVSLSGGLCHAMAAFSAVNKSTGGFMVVSHDDECLKLAGSRPG
jgi:hypothetical protein